MTWRFPGEKGRRIVLYLIMIALGAEFQTAKSSEGIHHYGTSDINEFAFVVNDVPTLRSMFE
jgi:hypothetical protein